MLTPVAKESYPLKNNNFILEYNVYLIVLLPQPAGGPS
jgi:hypothetical protein